MKIAILIMVLILTGCATCQDGWETGVSWTDGQTGTTTNPDGTIVPMDTASGPFINLCFMLGSTHRLQFYIGARPTAPQGIGVGNEGFLISFSEWLKNIGLGNYGFALKIQTVTMGQTSEN
jgi:hypothetical protein